MGSTIASEAGCTIRHEDGLLRACVGPGLADEVQHCYRTIANTCLTEHCQRVLIVGIAQHDAVAHLAGRDALFSMALAGVPDGFRLALVASTDDLVAVYDAAVREAQRLGIETRRFTSEEEAEHWLAA